MVWEQNYAPFSSVLGSAALAAIPLLILLGGIGIFHIRAHVAALLGLVAALFVAIWGFGMPASLAGWAATYGAAYGLLPIGWIILNIIFLYTLTNEQGQFDIIRRSIGRVSSDSRLQLLLVAFSFGAFFEGAAGFGAPVAVTGAMLIGLGFTRLQASGLSLIANTAPVAYGALGTPIVTLAAVTGLPVEDLSAMIGRQMVPFAIIVPFWLLCAYCGWRRALEVWPAALVAGVTFAITQLLVSNLHGPWLAAVISALVSMSSLLLLFRFWQPASEMAVNEAPLHRHDEQTLAVPEAGAAAAEPKETRAVLLRAWMPWMLLTALVMLWGIPTVKALLDGLFRKQIIFDGLHLLIARIPPVSDRPELEPAIYNLNLLSATGTAILFTGILSGLLYGMRPRQIIGTYGRAFRSVTPSLITIAAMLGLGYLTRYGGIDAAMGLAFAATGVFYPFFGTLLGWLGVAATGSDTASNVLFGGLQKVTAEQLDISPTLMAAANSSGGVMGKMIDAQSIVVASTATQWFGREGIILKYVLLHSIVLGCLVGGVVTLMAYVWPFTELVIR